MAYSTPSPSESCSNWSSGFSDSGTSVTGVAAGWHPRELDMPATPDMQYGNLSKCQAQQQQQQLYQHHQFSVTSAPQAVVTSSPTASTASSSSTFTTSHQRSTATIPTGLRGRRYAKDDEWAQNRERIAALYKTKRLKDVMAAMEAEHNFRATERMYKGRFKDWGLKKNVTAAEVDKVMKKVEKAQQTVQQQKQNETRAATQRSAPATGGGGKGGASCKTTVLDVGDELYVKRIQKYVKRDPVGLKKLVGDPKRVKDVIKALSVDTGKSRSGRPKVSIPTAKLEQQQGVSHFHIMAPSPGSDLMMPWTLGDGLPNTRDLNLPKDMTRLLQIIMDQDFNPRYPYACSPVPVSPAPSYQWHSHNHQSPMSPISSVTTEDLSLPDDMMLRFVLKFRLAHIMLEDGLTAQAFEMANVCVNILSARLQQVQGPDPRAVCTVVLFALSSALENAATCPQLDILHLLFQQLSLACAAQQQPRAAEFARRLGQLGSRAQLMAMLKLARRMMSRVALGAATGPGRRRQHHEVVDNPSLEMYSRSVNIAINTASAPDEKLRALRLLSAEPCVQKLDDGAVWLDARVALAVGDAPWAAQQQGLWSGNSLWKYSQESKTVIFLRYSEDRVEGHRAAGNWVAAEKWARELAWTADIALGFGDELARRFREVAEGLAATTAAAAVVVSPMLGDGEMVTPSAVSGCEMASKAAAVPVSGSSVAHSLPSLDTLTLQGLGLLQERAESALSASSWDQTHGEFHDATLPSLWTVEGILESGVGLYDNAF